MELEEGRPVNLGTTLLQSCAGGEPWAARWWSFDGKTARFRFDDGRLIVREKLRREYDNGDVGERNYTLEATVADGRVTGTMRLIENLDASGAFYVCESGEVSFSAEWR
jgi:hypothetical protein